MCSMETTPLNVCVCLHAGLRFCNPLLVMHNRMYAEFHVDNLQVFESHSLPFLSVVVFIVICVYGRWMMSNKRTSWWWNSVFDPSHYCCFAVKTCQRTKSCAQLLMISINRILFISFFILPITRLRGILRRFVFFVPP